MSRFLALCLIAVAPAARAATVGPIAPIRPLYAEKQGDAYAPKDLSSNLNSAKLYLGAAASYLSAGGAEPKVLDDIAQEVAFGDALLADAEAALGRGIPADGHFGSTYHPNGGCPAGELKSCEATHLANALGHLMTLVDSHRAGEEAEKRVEPSRWLTESKAALARTREGMRTAGIPVGGAVSEERLRRDQRAVEEARKRRGKKVGLSFGQHGGPSGDPAAGGDSMGEGGGSTAGEGRSDPPSQDKIASGTVKKGVAVAQALGQQTAALTQPAVGMPVAPAAQRPRSFRASAAAPPAVSDRGGAPSAVSATGATAAGEGGNATAGGGEDDEAVIRRVFAETVSELTATGQRRAGSGSFNGVVNNFSTIWNGKRIRCFDQAEILQARLDREFSSGARRGTWTFELRSYTGDLDHEKNGHWWVQAVPKDERVQKALTLDPWADTVKVETTRNPVVIKPYPAYWMGYVMDKVMN